MAYNYVVTAHKPTAVNTCVTGNTWEFLQLCVFEWSGAIWGIACESGVHVICE